MIPRNFVKNCVSYNYYCCITGYFRIAQLKNSKHYLPIPVSQKSGCGLGGHALDSGVSPKSHNPPTIKA